MTNSYSFVIYSLETGKWRTLGILNLLTDLLYRAVDPRVVLR